MRNRSFTTLSWSERRNDNNRGSLKFGSLISFILFWTFSTHLFAFNDLKKLQVPFLVHAGQSKSAVLFAYIKEKEYLLKRFDFQTNELRSIKDPSILVYLPFIVPYKDGFVLARRVREGHFYILNNQGELRESIPMASIPNITPEDRLIMAMEQDDHLLLTTASQATNKMKLLVLDLEERNADLWYEQPLSHFKQIGLPYGQHFLFVTEETGGVELRLPDEDFALEGELFPPQEPILKAKGQPGRTPHMAILSMPIKHGDRITFRYRKRQGDKIHSGALHISSSGKVVESEYYLLGSHKGADLMYDWNNRLLFKRESVMRQ